MTDAGACTFELEHECYGCDGLGHYTQYDSCEVCGGNGTSGNDLVLSRVGNDIRVVNHINDAGYDVEKLVGGEYNSTSLSHASGYLSNAVEGTAYRIKSNSQCATDWAYICFGTVDCTGECGGTAPDNDGDGVCDGDDICSGFDDYVDTDGDGTPDGCDQCPNDESNCL